MPRMPHDENKYNDKQKKMKNAFAARLKKCRESKGLSHEKLSEELGISKQALINYEVTDEYNSKYTAGFGMNITYLWQFAEYFDVSTDYLLGRSDVTKGSADDMALEERFGFDDSTISVLNKLSETITEEQAATIREEAAGKNGHDNIRRSMTKAKTSSAPFINMLFRYGFEEVILRLRETYEKFSLLDRELAMFFDRPEADSYEERVEIEFDIFVRKTIYDFTMDYFDIVQDDNDEFPPYALRREGPEGYLKTMTRDVVADKLIEIIKEMVEQESEING